MKIFQKIFLCCEPNKELKQNTHELVYLEDNVISKSNNSNQDKLENKADSSSNSNFNSKINKLEASNEKYNSENNNTVTSSSFNNNINNNLVTIKNTFQEQIITNNFNKNSSPKIDEEKNNIEVKSKNSKNSILSILDLKANKNKEIEEIGGKLLLSGELFFWNQIVINTHGMKNGLRKKNDDFVYFGIKKTKDYKGDLYNDFIINFNYQQENNDTIGSNTGRVFEIYYNKKIKDYVLYFLHRNIFLYYKINNFIYFDINKEYYLILGNVFMTINVKRQSPSEKMIYILIEAEKNEDTIEKSFSQKQVPIKIGRLNCEININKTPVSKLHGIIDFSTNSQMFYYKDMGSSNGSTLLIRETDSIRLKGEMNFKLDDVPFKIQEIP